MGYKQSAKRSKEKSNPRTIFTNTWLQISYISILIGIINVFIPKLGHVMLVTFWVTVIIVFVGLASLYILMGLFRGEKIGDIVRKMGQSNKREDKPSLASLASKVSDIERDMGEIKTTLNSLNQVITEHIMQQQGKTRGKAHESHSLD